MTLETPEISTLHLFASGAWDFLLGSAALSAVVALISTAVEEAVRPDSQSAIVATWFKQMRWAPSPDEPPPPRWWTEMVSSEGAWFPPTFFALPPDQLCAQILRRFQSEADRFEKPPPPGADETKRPDEASSEWIDRLEERLDELQSNLVQATLARSYRHSALGVIGLGVILFIASTPNIDPGLARRAGAAVIAQWAMLTLVFGVVATLLSPILQGTVSRVLRSR